MELGNYKLVKHPNQHSTRWGRFTYATKQFIKKLGVLLGKMSIIAVMVAVYTQYTTPEHVIANTITLHDTTEYPVLQRIAGCESEGNPHSKGSQFDSKGKLRMHVNKDGTVDIGKNMINEYFWEAKAVELGYNIYVEAGNDAMAKWIYFNKGTGDWSASAKCWNK